jgi:hypothetical protein
MTLSDHMIVSATEVPMLMARQASPRSYRGPGTQTGQSLSHFVQDGSILAHTKLLGRWAGIELPPPQNREFLRPTQPGRLYDLSGTGEHRAWHQSRPFQLHAAELAHLPPPDQPGHLIDETLLRPKRSGCARLSVPEFFFPAW